MNTPMRRRGRPPIDPADRLVGNAIHMKPQARRDLRLIVAYHKNRGHKPDSQRQFLEKAISLEKQRLLNSAPFRNFMSTFETSDD